MAKKGFTLIELLVTVVIIGVMLAIMVPVVGKARSSANVVLCASNLRQLFLAATLFAEDRGCYPRSYLPSTPEGTNYAAEPDFFPNYLDGDKGVLRCPEVKGYFNDDPPVFSYGWFWGRIEPASAGVAFTYDMEKESSLVPMFADSDYPIISNQYVLDKMHVYYGKETSPNNPADFNGSGNVDLLDLGVVGDYHQVFDYRHRRRANIIYFDGHIESIKQ